MLYIDKLKFLPSSNKLTYTMLIILCWLWLIYKKSKLKWITDLNSKNTLKEIIFDWTLFSDFNFAKVYTWENDISGSVGTLLNSIKLDIGANVKEKIIELIKTQYKKNTTKTVFTSARKETTKKTYKPSNAIKWGKWDKWDKQDKSKNSIFDL